MRGLLMDALRKKLDIISGYEEHVSKLTRKQIEEIVCNDQQEGNIEERHITQNMQNFQFHYNEPPKDMHEKRILANSLKNSIKTKKSKKYNSTIKKRKSKGGSKFSGTVSSFDPSEKEIIKKKMIDRMLRSREPPRKSKRITRLAMTQKSGTGRSRTPTRRGGRKLAKTQQADDMLNKI